MDRAQDEWWEFICHNNIRQIQVPIEVAALSRTSYRLLKVWAGGKEGNFDPTLIETETLRTALILARSNSWDRVSFGSSSKCVIQKVQDRNSEDIRLATLLEDTIQLSDQFSCCSFVWIPSHDNIKATELAFFAIDLTSDIFWID
ncbi:hypothetical protein ACH5RR_012599 [Cinchona calisaya]|uniref:RNase H type-1 domain-containing protein n=1 Tax=Cinchona calisaya TaxID=153742 RepID=A0ABD3AE05_9GENT